MFCDPRAELALAIHAKTDNGNKIVDFLKDVLDQNIPDVRLSHRLQSARMLTKHGHFPDAELFIQRHANKPSRKLSRREKKELSQFDAALAEVIRAEISPASTAQWLIDVMQGRTPAIETGIDTFKPHHRMRAVREILARAYDRDYDYSQTTQADLRVPTHTDAEVTPEDHPDPDTTVVPGKAGTQGRGAVQAARNTKPSYSLDHPHASEQDAGESENPVHPEHPANPDSDEEPVDLVAIAKEIAENLDPSELEEEPPTTYKPSYAMWDIINKQPRPVITEEHARIGSARFNARMEQQIAWRESSVKIPTRKDRHEYDDG